MAKRCKYGKLKSPRRNPKTGAMQRCKRKPKSRRKRR